MESNFVGVTDHAGGVNIYNIALLNSPELYVIKVNKQ